MLRAINRRPKWWVFTAVTLSLAMVFADQSALPVALASIQRQFHAPQDVLQWVVNAYLLALAVLVILGGKLGDRIGHRRAFLGGMTLFILSSVACALAPSIIWLIIGRVIQGVGAAFMLPAGTPLFRSTVPNNEFGKMAGLYVSGASVFLVLGPSLGGLLVQYLSWRWIFWINFPLALIGILIAWFVVPKDVPQTKPEAAFDWWGFIWFSMAIVSLVYALMQGGQMGWASYSIIGCGVVSLVSGVIFFLIETRKQHPFLELELFKNSTFSRAVSVLSLMQGIFVCVVFWALFLQLALALPPGKVGFVLLATQGPVLLCSYPAGYFLDRFGPRRPICFGILLVIVSSLWIAFFAWYYSVAWLFPGLVMFGVAIPFITLTCITTIISSAPRPKSGVASAIANGMRQVAASIGLAVISTLISGVSNFQFLHWLGQHSLSLNILGVQHLGSLLSGAAKATTAVPVHQAAVHAYTLAFSVAMCLVALISLLALGIARKLPHKEMPEINN